jgi:hypothetical protein
LTRLLRYTNFADFGEQFAKNKGSYGAREHHATGRFASAYRPVAEQEGLNRSKLIRLAFMAYCEQREAAYNHQCRQADIEHGMALQGSLRSKVPGWDTLKVLREERDAR